jgi:hypothetical protein
MEITKHGLLMLMSKGNATMAQCSQAWEQLVQDNARATNSGKLTNYTLSLKQLRKLIAEYNVIKSMLALLVFEIDDEDIAYLGKKGYHIETQSGQKAFETSLYEAMAKSEMISTNLLLKVNELNQYKKKKQAVTEQPLGFQEMMAHLNFKLKIVESEDITLARYNEYCKIIKQQAEREAQQAAAQRRKRTPPKRR